AKAPCSTIGGTLVNRTIARNLDDHSKFERTFGIRTVIRSSGDHSEFGRSFEVRGNVRNSDGHSEFEGAFGFAMAASTISRALWSWASIVASISPASVRATAPPRDTRRSAWR